MGGNAPRTNCAHTSKVDNALQLLVTPFHTNQPMRRQPTPLSVCGSYRWDTSCKQLILATPPRVLWLADVYGRGYGRHLSVRVRVPGVAWVLLQTSSCPRRIDRGPTTKAFAETKTLSRALRSLAGTTTDPSQPRAQLSDSRVVRKCVLRCTQHGAGPNPWTVKHGVGFASVFLVVTVCIHPLGHRLDRVPRVFPRVG